MMKQHSTEWLSLLENRLAKTNQLPALEERFAFPWEEATDLIKQALQLEKLSLSATAISWKEVDQIDEGLGKHPFIVSINMSPLRGEIFWILSQQDVALLSSYLLFKQFNPDEMTNGVVQKGFYQFILLKILNGIDQISFFKETSFSLNTTDVFPTEKSLCIDVKCELNSKTLKGCLACPESFWKEFKNHYPLYKNPLMSSDQLDSTKIYLRPSLGFTTLSKEEWDSLQVGDFMVLDHCLYHYEEKKGSITLNLGDTQLLMARIKPDGIKILDYIFHSDNHSEEGPDDMVQKDASKVTVSAEFNPIPFTLNQLIAVSPGDSIPLAIPIEQEINIVFKGSVRAKGILLQLGEVVGLRITTIESE